MKSVADYIQEYEMSMGGNHDRIPDYTKVEILVQKMTPRIFSELERSERAWHRKPYEQIKNILIDIDDSIRNPPPWRPTLRARPKGAAAASRHTNTTKRPTPETQDT